MKIATFVRCPRVVQSQSGPLPINLNATTGAGATNSVEADPGFPVRLVLNGGAGSDTLTGGAGNDLVNPGLGNDDVDGGAGLDTIDYANNARTVGVTVDLGDDTFSGEANETSEKPIAFEDVNGSELGDNLSGDDADNFLLGGDGPDSLGGRGGPDYLYGGAAADFLVGGDADDILVGGDAGDSINGQAGSDTTSYEDRTTPVSVDLAALQAPDGDMMSGIENVTGGTGADTLKGDGDPNRLDGLAGADTLTGRAGADTVLYGSRSTGVQLNLATGANTEGDVYSELERAEGTPFADNLTAGPAGSTLLGGFGRDTLTGGAGPDRLEGGNDNDTVTGRGGVDVLLLGAGNDAFAATDAIQDTVDCGTGADSGGADRVDRLSGCESVSLPALPAAPGLPGAGPAARLPLITAKVAGSFRRSARFIVIRKLERHGAAGRREGRAALRRGEEGPQEEGPARALRIQEEDRQRAPGHPQAGAGQVLQAAAAPRGHRRHDHRQRAGQDRQGHPAYRAQGQGPRPPGHLRVAQRQARRLLRLESVSPRSFRPSGLIPVLDSVGSVSESEKGTA